MSLSELRKIHSKFHYNGLTLDQWKSITNNILKEEAPNNEQDIGRCMKIIKINGCKTCPYNRGGTCYAPPKDTGYCPTMADWYRQIQPCDLPWPGWCPLDDVTDLYDTE